MDGAFAKTPRGIWKVRLVQQLDEVAAALIANPELPTRAFRRPLFRADAVREELRHLVAVSDRNRDPVRAADAVFARHAALFPRVEVALLVNAHERVVDAARMGERQPRRAENLDFLVLNSGLREPI